MGNKANKRTNEEQAAMDYKLGKKFGERGDAYINIYQHHTDNFTNFETGFFDGKEAHLKKGDSNNGR